jgi:hypothetical protein
MLYPPQTTLFRNFFLKLDDNLSTIRCSGCSYMDYKLISFFISFFPTSSNADCIYGVEIVHRIVVEFLEVEKHIGLSEACYCSPSVIKICRVLDSYLAEIANEPNLSVEKFVAIPIVMPKQARDVEDSLYRAIDIYLKVREL